MKVYIVLVCEDDSVEIPYVTSNSKKAKDIQNLWDIVEKHQHESWENHLMENALKKLKKKYHIITWSGAELSIEERELL
jgi:hypothetical protein